MAGDERTIDEYDGRGFLRLDFVTFQVYQNTIKNFYATKKVSVVLTLWRMRCTKRVE